MTNFTDRLRKTLSVLAAAVLTVLCLEYTGVLIEPGNELKCRANIRAFHQIPENSCELMIYGSSHSWRGIDTLQLYEEYGIGAYNYGTFYQNMNTTALFFYDSLRTQKPKAAIFELYKVNQLVEDVPTTSEIYYTREIPGFPAKWEYLRTAFGCHPLRYITYMVPVFLYRDNWRYFLINGFFANYKAESFAGTMGFSNSDELLDVCPTAVPDPAFVKQEPLSEKAEVLLDDIVRECRKNDIVPVFIVIPSSEEYTYADAVQAFADKNGVTFLNLYDYMEETGIDPEKDFGDETHLNQYGAKKLTAFLGEYLSEHCDFRDMRQVPDNLWAGKAGNRITPGRGLPPIARLW